jgi:hypothetical protein
MEECHIGGGCAFKGSDKCDESCPYWVGKKEEKKDETNIKSVS